MPGPRTVYADQIHAVKYRQEGENFTEAMARISFSLAENGKQYSKFHEILNSMRFIPAGRIQAAIGTEKNVTAMNCVVSSTIRDSLVVDQYSIMDCLKEAAAVLQMGAGIGYDFSTLRPEGTLIKKLNSYASGPLSFMEIFNALCLTISSAGHRRGAQMGILRVDHPDIEKFVTYKNDLSKLSAFNISVGITDKFMEAVTAKKNFDLKFEGKVVKTIDAAELWDKIMLSTWDYAEPGVVFLNTINRMNPLSYAENLAATNPCAEQPLPPNGCCCLGSFNLAQYVKKGVAGDPDKFYIDTDQLKVDVPIAVRMLDRVIDVSKYPLESNRDEMMRKRRIGLGVMGMANAIEAMGYPYGSDNYLTVQDSILGMIQIEAWRASINLAKEKGKAPIIEDTNQYITTPFAKKNIPQELRDLIAIYGIRNSHLTSIAPTGTITMIADNVSSAIEPTFEAVMNRDIIMPEGKVTVQLEDYGVVNFGNKPKVSSQLSVDDHIKVLLGAAKFVDSSVSKTCNIGSSVTFDEFKQVYKRAWEGGAKGCSTYRANGKRAGVLRAAAETMEITDEGGSCYITPDGQKFCE